ncbi:ferredoxin [Planomonospora sp. ID82291]|uniref:ferredoxin n=1 Tax=Planomonospora sp. ID82291 TaxID=2738136 RepID=UPI0018C3CDB5|nr:ferredoxin [Planomonospora sp. ID82291]MBG0817905.1 ferredoxin [Planomonospora sp. ID82291]
MTVRPDERLLDGHPMLPVRCRTCGAGVQARKASWQQTSVQWSAEAVRTCRERRASVPGEGPNGGVFPACEALHASITQAALDGELPVPDDPGPGPPGTTDP